MPRVLRLCTVVLFVAWAWSVLSAPWPSTHSKELILIASDADGTWHGLPGQMRSPRAMAAKRVLAIFVAETEYAGVGVPLWRSGWVGIRIHGINTGFSADQAAEYRDRAIRAFHARGHFDGASARVLRGQGIASGTQVVWRGVWNAVALVAGTVAAVMIMPWLWLFVELPRRARAWLRRRPDPTRCIGCNYPLAGLPTRTCPECGRVNEPAAALS